jgi:pSer/pThr/pTyr-binding forkhead associated (FHA) protein
MSYIEVYFNSVLCSTIELKEGAANSIGRMPDNVVCLDNQGVSSHHAIITQKKDSIILKTLIVPMALI